jgi:7-carboxy-7-deazaguanine synthase
MKIIRLHPDKIVTRKDYEFLPKESLWVHGEFTTIQGEGPFMGHPAYFVRLAGCNYGDKQGHCGGRGLSCDTEFTFSKGRPVTIYELVERIKDTKIPLVVITGGEPLLQIEPLTKLSDYLYRSDLDIHIQVETNGVYASQKAVTPLTDNGDTIVISPKAHEVHGYNRNHIRNIIELATYNPKVNLKFLIGSEEEVYSDIPTSIAPSLATRTYLSPITVYADSYTGEIANSWNPKLVNQQQTAKNHARAATLALKYRCKLSIQIHNFVSIP